jgi:hypothetical protein
VFTDMKSITGNTCFSAYDVHTDNIKGPREVVSLLFFFLNGQVYIFMIVAAESFSRVGNSKTAGPMGDLHERWRVYAEHITDSRQSEQPGREPPFSPAFLS